MNHHSSKSSSSKIVSDIDTRNSDNSKFVVLEELPISVNVDSRNCNGLLPSTKSVPTWKRFTHSIGGSRSIVPTQKTRCKSKDELKANYDFNCALKKIGGMEAMVELK